MSERNTFYGKTVLLAGAGCPTGDALASGFANVGGRVIAIDRDERRVLGIAAHNPDRIDPLRLDVLVPDQTRMFANVWEAEPLDVLVHLQPLRHIDDLTSAIGSILTLSDHLRPGLKAGQGCIVVAFQETPDAVKTFQGQYLPTLEQLARTLQPAFDGAGVTVNAICLPAQTDADVLHEFLRVITWLTAPSAPLIHSTLLRLKAQGD